MDGSRATDEPQQTSGGPLKRLWKDDRGAAFLEFIIVVYAYLFVLLGVAQTGLMVCASMYTTYGNFMALRSAAIYYEPYKDGFLSQNEFEGKCKGAALSAMGPIERYYYKHDMDFQARSQALNRIKFVYEEGSESFDGEANSLKGRLEYDYPLIVPFVGRVITGVVKSGVPAADRVGGGFALDTEGLGSKYPLLKLKSNNDLGTGSNPRPHEMVIQRRWKFTTEQD